MQAVTLAVITVASLPAGAYHLVRDWQPAPLICSIVVVFAVVLFCFCVLVILKATEDTQR